LHQCTRYIRAHNLLPCLKGGLHVNSQEAGLWHFVGENGKLKICCETIGRKRTGPPKRCAATYQGVKLQQNVAQAMVQADDLDIPPFTEDYEPPVPNIRRRRTMPTHRRPG
jgi:hypothetical protein